MLNVTFLQPFAPLLPSCHRLQDPSEAVGGIQNHELKLNLRQP